jgi:GAF domain-containing protein
MAASLDLETTLQTILESVERLIPADSFSEINLWEPESRLFTPYRLAGGIGLDGRSLEKSAGPTPAGEGFAAQLAARRAPLLFRHRQLSRRGPRGVGQMLASGMLTSQLLLPFRSYLGLPLTVAEKLIGTIELSSLSPGAFTGNDLEVLQLVSGQAALALHNACLFELEQRRALELSGLAQLAQAAGSLRDPQDLFARLVDSITPLLDLEILGFLVWDETRRTLEAIAPFLGLPQAS